MTSEKRKEIKELRLKLNLSVKQVADDLNISKGVVYATEVLDTNKPTAVVSRDTFKQIEDYYKSKLDDTYLVEVLAGRLTPENRKLVITYMKNLISGAYAEQIKTSPIEQTCKSILKMKSDISEELENIDSLKKELEWDLATLSNTEDFDNKTRQIQRLVQYEESKLRAKRILESCFRNLTEESYAEAISRLEPCPTVPIPIRTKLLEDSYKFCKNN